MCPDDGVGGVTVHISVKHAVWFLSSKDKGWNKFPLPVAPTVTSNPGQDDPPEESINHDVTSAAQSPLAITNFECP